jgi:hypothetical protein
MVCKAERAIRDWEKISRRRSVVLEDFISV